MAAGPDAAATPARARVRMYRVGFGDCFVLSFEYAAPLSDGRSERHILVDFGTTSLPRSVRSLLPIAKRIREHTGGRLDVVVATHRHRDHLSAFGSRELSGQLVARGYPRLVVRPWTEDPDARRHARKPAGARGISAAVGDRSAAFLTTLERAETFAEQLAAKTPKGSPRSLAGALHQLAADQVKNREAVDRLAGWAEAGSAAYLHYGKPSGIEDFVPGISVRVLGPPTVDQYPGVASQRSSDPDEFWMLYRSLLASLGPEDLSVSGKAEETAEQTAEEEAPAAPAVPEAELPATTAGFGEPGPVRWLTDRMGRQRLNSLLRIVRILDGALNNTSLILLIDVPGARRQRLLFSGDAQIENWEYALKVAKDRKANRDLLREVDLYKVGHHGSRNATPRTLFNLWLERRTRDRAMTALLSTKGGVHGESTATAVPRATLKAALDTRMTLYSTQSLKADRPYLELVADLATTDGFQRVGG